jgi:hypothetical protein
MQRWNENQFDEEPYPGPFDQLVVRGSNIIITSRQFGKQSNITGFMQSNLYLPPSFLPPNAGFGSIEMSAESLTKFSQRIKNLPPASMDEEPYTESRPPHSMSPPGGRIYDRRGRQKY